MRCCSLTLPLARRRARTFSRPRGNRRTAEPTTPNRETLERFVARVEENAHADAIGEFYADNPSMQENPFPGGADSEPLHRRGPGRECHTVASAIHRKGTINWPNPITHSQNASAISPRSRNRKKSASARKNCAHRRPVNRRRPHRTTPKKPHPDATPVQRGTPALA